MKQIRYDPERLATYLKKLIEERGLTLRQASLQANLNHGAVAAFVRGRRPHRDSCLILAEFFNVDPNEMLAAAGYDPMPQVDRSLIDPNEFAPEVKEFAAELMKFNSNRRREIIDGVRMLLKAE